jgi:hypothetical protein
MMSTQKLLNESYRISRNIYEEYLEGHLTEKQMKASLKAERELQKTLELFECDVY